MLQALAPRRFQGCPRVRLSVSVPIALAITFALAGLPGRALGQAEEKTKGSSAPAKKDAGKADASKGAPKAEPKGAAGAAEAKDASGAPAPVADPDSLVDPTQAKKAERAQTFQDPKAEAALDISKFKPIAAPRGATPARNEIMGMASGQSNLDPKTVQTWVAAQAAALTSHNNLKAVIAPEPGQRGAVTRAFENAGTGLIDPLVAATNAKNDRFRQEYNRALLATLPKLLDNHLLARTEAMMVLGMTGDTEAVAIFLQQIKDPEQVMMVKLWALRGLINVAQGGKRTLEAGKATNAARALTEFLQAGDHPWILQRYALEALGSLRLATDPRGTQAEMANVALKSLTDPKAHPQVRARAAWALGMMTVPSAVRYNYALVAHALGQAAVDVGDELLNAYADGNSVQASRLAGLLLYQVLGGFRGIDDVRDSGILKSPNLGQSRAAVSAIGNRVQDVAVTAVNLVSPTTSRRDRPKLKEKLVAQVSDLRDFLAKNPPSDRHLVPGGPEFAGPPAQVAGGKAPK